MSENPDQDRDEATDASVTPASSAPGPRHRFDGRKALIYCVGAFVIVLVFAVVLAFFDKGSDSSRADSRTIIDGGSIKLGHDDSTFTATTLPPSGLVASDGTVTDLRSVVDGKPTMLNFFSTSCTACRTEMPDLEKLHRAAGDKVQIVGVNLGDSQSGTDALVRQTKVTYPIVRDPNQLLVTPLNITAQPMTLWIAPDGKIVGHRYGALTPTEMRLALKDYLGVTAPAA